jgi:hypothetical protein
MSRGLQSCHAGPWSDSALARLRSIAKAYGWPAFMQLLAMIAAVGTVFAAAYMYLTYLREPEQSEFQVRAGVNRCGYGFARLGQSARGEGWA